MLHTRSWLFVTRAGAFDSAALASAENEIIQISKCLLQSSLISVCTFNQRSPVEKQTIPVSDRQKRVWEICLESFPNNKTVFASHQPEKMVLEGKLLGAAVIFLEGRRSSRKTIVNDIIRLILKTWKNNYTLCCENLIGEMVNECRCGLKKYREYFSWRRVSHFERPNSPLHHWRSSNDQDSKIDSTSNCCCVATKNA